MIKPELLEYIMDKGLDRYRSHLPRIVHEYARYYNIVNSDFEWLLWNWLPPQLRKSDDIAEMFNDLEYTSKAVVEKWLRQGTPPMTLEECIDHCCRFYNVDKNNIEYYCEDTWTRMT